MTAKDELAALKRHAMDGLEKEAEDADAAYER